MRKTGSTKHKMMENKAFFSSSRKKCWGTLRTLIRPRMNNFTIFSNLHSVADVLQGVLHWPEHLLCVASSHGLAPLPQRVYSHHPKADGSTAGLNFIWNTKNLVRFTSSTIYFTIAKWYCFLKPQVFVWWQDAVVTVGIGNGNGGRASTATNSTSINERRLQKFGFFG